MRREARVICSPLGQYAGDIFVPVSIAAQALSLSLSTKKDERKTKFSIERTMTEKGLGLWIRLAGWDRPYASHTCTVLSSLPEAMYLPSGDHTTDHTELVWPL
jgi:hypothetical protein